MVDGKAMIDIIYEDNHLLVVNKPINVPTQGDSSCDKDLLTMLKEYLKDRYNKPGNVYLGLVHRLDRPVGGVMVFAKTSKAASRLSKQIRENTFNKVYYAVIMGNIEKENTLKDKLYKDKKNNKVYVRDDGKEAILSFKKIAYMNGMSLVCISLKTGRSHQIRVQFMNHGFPLFGDNKYNVNARSGEQIALFAKKISFKHPVTNEVLTFEIDLPNRYPFNIFRRKDE